MYYLINEVPVFGVPPVSVKDCSSKDEEVQDQDDNNRRYQQIIQGCSVTILNRQCQVEEWRALQCFIRVTNIFIHSGDVYDFSFVLSQPSSEPNYPTIAIPSIITQINFFQTFPHFFWQ